MLMIGLVLFLAAGALVAFATILNGAFKQRLAGVAATVNGEVEDVLRKSQEANHLLSKRLADGKPTSQCIEDWQTEVAGLVALGRTSRPWAWTADELKSWARQRIAARRDEIRRSHLVTLVVGTVLIVAVSGGASLGWYQLTSAAKAREDAFGGFDPAVDADQFSDQLSNQPPADPSANFAASVPTTP